MERRPAICRCRIFRSMSLPLETSPIIWSNGSDRLSASPPQTRPLNGCGAAETLGCRSCTSPPTNRTPTNGLHCTMPWSGCFDLYTQTEGRQPTHTSAYSGPIAIVPLPDHHP
jgi:hypothetical protein